LHNQVLTKWTFRIVIFYILGVIMTGMLVPYNDKRLLQATGNAAQSPYVIAMQIAGIKGLPHVVNAGVFTSAFSAGNSFLYTSSRVLYGLALRGQAPRVFIKCTKEGLPWVAVVTCAAFSLLSFLNISSSSAQAFNWLVSLSAVGSFFSWFSINLTYLGFCEWPQFRCACDASVLT
jgi:yeast amino acid transporter